MEVLKKANIQSGQRVLICGASGTVGTYAIQLARSLEARVTGVCSTKNLEIVRSLGTNRVIDYTREDLVQSGKTYDVVMDAVDRISPSRGRKALKKMGIYLNVGRHSGSGDIPKEAHRYVEQGHKRENVVITVEHSDSQSSWRTDRRFPMTAQQASSGYFCSGLPYNRLGHGPRILVVFQGLLAEIKAPTLVIAGACDRFYSEALFRETAAGIPNARVILYPGKDHGVSGKQYEEDVLAFLREGMS